MKLKIKVTKEILYRSRMCGKQKNDAYQDVATNCAIALAVRDIFPNAAVDQQQLRFYGNGDRINQIKLSDAVWAFVDKFDESSPSQRLRMQKISFEIDVPEVVIESIGLSEVHRILKESKTLELA